MPFALPGEIVEGEILADRMVSPRIIEPVEARINPACHHFKTCGGCVTQHMRDQDLAEWKQNAVRETLKRFGLEPEFRSIKTSPPQSRRRAVFSARRTKKSAIIGFHGRASDVLIEIHECALVKPGILAGFAGLKELTKLGASRSAEIRIAVTDSIGGLDIDVQDAKALKSSQLIEVAAIAQTYRFARVAWNGDVVLEIQPPHQQFGFAQVLPPAGSFLQATSEGEAALVEAVTEIAGGARRIVDLFSGCGTFSLPLSATAEVHAVETEADMLAALDAGWRRTTRLKRVTTEARDLYRRPLLTDELKGFDAAVIDPPRAGAKAQVEVLGQTGIDKIAFVSCNPATFARDAEVLIAGGYQLDWVQVVDQFRWSTHSELVGRFRRR